MLDEKGFDLWANGYDQSVKLGEISKRYPFVAYREVLNEVYRLIKQTNSKGNILDIGFGTGILTKKLYDDGYLITGIDFSKKMIEIAEKKMPDAKLFQSDFLDGLPPEIMGMNFDFIISTYAIHHLDDKQKIMILKQMLNTLTANGRIIFGDVMTETVRDMAKLKKKDYDIWDEDEYYLVAENVQIWFPECTVEFMAKSYCSGVLVITK